VLTPLLLVADSKLRPEAHPAESVLAALVNKLWGTALVNTRWGAALVNTRWGATLVNKPWGAALVNKPWGAELVNTPWGAALVNMPWGTAVVAVVACLALLSWSPLELALLTVPVTALLVVYIALIPRTVAGPRLLPLIPDVEDAVLSLSGKVVILLVGVLACQAFAFGIHSIELGLAGLLLGLVKAGFWYFAIQTVRPLSALLHDRTLTSFRPAIPPGTPPLR
jgi:hypothetical protein